MQTRQNGGIAAAAAAICAIIVAVSGNVLLPNELGSAGTPSPGCQPTGPLTSACQWTGNCPVTGCVNKCIVNTTRLDLRVRLEDGAFEPDWFKACSSATVWMRLLSSSQLQADRRLLEDITATTGNSKDLASFMDAVLHGRGLLQTIDTAADSTAWGCPSEEELQAVEQQVTSFGAMMLEIYRTAFSGGEGALTQQQTEVFERFRPYRRQMALFSTLFSNFTRLGQFYSTMCESKQLTGRDLAFLFPFETVLRNFSNEALYWTCQNQGYGMSEFLQRENNYVRSCAPNPSTCLDTSQGQWLPWSRPCTTRAAEVFNVSAGPLLEAQRLLEQLNLACNTLTEARCEEALAVDEVTAIENYLEALPYPDGFKDFIFQATEAGGVDSGDSGTVAAAPSPVDIGTASEMADRAEASNVPGSTTGFDWLAEGSSALRRRAGLGGWALVLLAGALVSVMLLL